MSSGKIVVGIDGSSNAVTALRWAIEQAAATSNEVEAVHVFFVPVLAYSADGYIPPEQLDAEGQAQYVFDEAIAGVPQPDAAKVHLRVVEGYPPNTLAQISDEPDVSLMVIGVRGHGNIEELFLGSVSHSLTHRCHKPLVIVPRRWERGDGRIVVGVSGSPDSLRALRWAVDFARFRQVTVEALTVFSSRVHEEEAKAGASTILADSVAQVNTAGVQVAAVALEGDPVEVLLAQAKGADMLVVGTRGLGRFREALTGSVTHSCAEHSTAPVTIVRGYPPPDD